MSDAIYVFNGKDITMNVCMQIRAVIDVLQDRLGIDFIEAIDRFYTLKTYLTLQQVENGLWAETQEYIADRFMEESDGNPQKVKPV